MTTSVTPDSAALFEKFKARAEAVSAEVHRFATTAEAREFLTDFLILEGGTAVCCAMNAFDGMPVGAGSGVTREAAAAAKIGISEMDFAIADTGTLVQDATAVERRLASTLPEIHVAIVSSDSIVPDLPAALARFNPRQIPFVSMITGPSRTADIERVLTIGVHGPSRLIVLFIDDLERPQ